MAGDSTRDSAKEIRNPASSPGCPGGGGQHPRDSAKGIRDPASSLGYPGAEEGGSAPWIQVKESGIPLALWGALGVGDRNRARQRACSQAS